MGHLLCLLCLLVSTLLSMPTNSISIHRKPMHHINNRPIIGIIAQHTQSRYGDEQIEAMYVHFLELAGARVVPIRGNQPERYYKNMFKNINGVLFPGGGVNLTASPYATSAKMFYEMAIEANKKGDFFPIWGTCLGFEALAVITSGKGDILSNTDTENATLPVTFYPGYRNSRLFANAPKDVVNYLSQEPVTQNNHHFSLLYETYENTPALQNFYQLLSTSIGRDRKKFVSIFEARNFPFYGVQWHPEKALFLWRTDQAINHDMHAERVTQYMANFFVSEARKSLHGYDSTDEEARAVIENYRRVYVPDFAVGEVYYFNYSNRGSQFNPLRVVSELKKQYEFVD